MSNFELQIFFVFLLQASAVEKTKYIFDNSKSMSYQGPNKKWFTFFRVQNVAKLNPKMQKHRRRHYKIDN